MTSLQDKFLQMEEIEDFQPQTIEETNFNPLDPLKSKDAFRNFEDSARQVRVEDFYKKQHSFQTVEFVRTMHEKHLNRRNIKMSLWEALEYLDTVVDDSDPDTNLSQLEHALQTAESIRRKFPDEKMQWLWIVGLIHDLGKILAVNDPSRGLLGEPQWAVVGDTFPVGCPFEDSNIFPQFFKLNPDVSNPMYNSGSGMYTSSCGFSNMIFSWGHDEYLYQILKRHNESLLPLEALYVIRFHSFYPWHKNQGYRQYTDSQDIEFLPWLKEFNQFDLYSKSEELGSSKEELKSFYRELLERFVPGTLYW